MVLRCTNWGMQVGRFLTSILTPLIASRFGWKAAPLAYAAIAAAIALPWVATCTENDEFCILYDELCITNDEL